MARYCAVPDCGRELPRRSVRACGRCEQRIRSWLTELDYQMPILRALLQHDRAPTEGTIHGGRAHSPLPVRGDVLNLLGAGSNTTLADPYDETRGDQDGPLPITATLTGWAEATAEHIRLRTGRPEPGRHEGTGPRATPALRPGGTWTAWLTAYLPQALTADWIGDLHDELRTLLARVRGITHTEPQSHPQDAPCPGCSAFGLVETDWAPYIECTVCQLLLTRAEYQNHARSIMPQLYRTALRLVIAHHTQEKAS